MNNYAKSGSKTDNFYLQIYTCLIGMLPILMIVRVPMTGIGFATLFLGVISPFIVLQNFRHIKIAKYRLILAFFIYVIARNINIGILPILFFISLVHIFGAENSINHNLLLKTIVFFSVLSSIVVIIQVIFHYAFSLDIRTLFDVFLLDEYYGAKGYSVKGLFRPSAFFLEPAHFAQYTCVALLYLLLYQRNSRIKIVIITAGILLTTSGIGLGLCCGAYIFAAYRNAVRKKFKIISILVSFSLLAIVFFILLKVNSVSLSLQRIFGEVNGYNAISGRSVYWNTTVGTLRGIEKLIGVGGINDYSSVFLTGLNTLIYCYGYLGLSLFLLAIVQIFFLQIKTNLLSAILCVVYIGLVIAADVVGFINLSFWFILLTMENYDENIDDYYIHVT